MSKKGPFNAKKLRAKIESGKTVIFQRFLRSNFKPTLIQNSCTEKLSNKVWLKNTLFCNSKEKNTGEIEYDGSKCLPAQVAAAFLGDYNTPQAMPYFLHKPQRCGKCSYCKCNISVRAVTLRNIMVLRFNQHFSRQLRADPVDIPQYLISFTLVILLINC
jgi:hypothetical protein